MKTINTIVRAATSLLGGLCVLMLAAVVVLTIVQVFWRYVLNDALSWSEELARWCFVWTVFLGSALLVAQNRHMRIEFLVGKVSDAKRKALDGWAQVVIAATCFAMLIHGWDFCARVTGTSGSLEWESKYLYMAVPVGAALSLLFVASGKPLCDGHPGLPRWSGLVVTALGWGLYQLMLSATPWLVLGWGVGWSLHVIALGLMFLDVPIAFCLVFGAYASFSKQGELMLLPISQTLATSANQNTNPPEVK